VFTTAADAHGLGDLPSLHVFAVQHSVSGTHLLLHQMLHHPPSCQLLSSSLMPCTGTTAGLTAARSAETVSTLSKCLLFLYSPTVCAVHVCETQLQKAFQRHCKFSVQLFGFIVAFNALGSDVIL
jgi:hypothetical protein